MAKPAISGAGPIKFIKQAIQELRKVSWPNRQQTSKLTLIVIGVSIVVGAYIGLLDYFYTLLISTLIK